MQDSLRLFVAAALPASVSGYLAEQSSRYQDAAIRLVPLPNLHLTLFFLGSTPPEALPALEEKLSRTAQQHNPFQLTLQCLEPGPKPRSPRLIWARFKQSQPFEELVHELAQQISPLPQHKQKAIPHVTLARFRKDKPVPASLPVILPQETVTLPVSALSLWKSELASPHPVYSVLRNFPLGQNLSPLSPVR